MHYTYNFSTQKEKFAEQIYTLLVENFSETYFVGGTVRDMLLHQVVNDIDIATNATPQAVKKILEENNIELGDEFDRFGILIAKQDDNAIEIATFRDEVYANSRYPQVRFISSFEMDAKRRDFTINALYFSPKQAIIKDPVDGLSDLQKKIIRFIGDPDRRIIEDPLRILRAYRFKIELGFALENKTEHALQKYLHLLHTISKNRITTEIRKLSSADLQNELQKVIHKNA